MLEDVFDEVNFDVKHKAKEKQPAYKPIVTISADVKSNELMF